LDAHCDHLTNLIPIICVERQRHQIVYIPSALRTKHNDEEEVSKKKPKNVRLESEMKLITKTLTP